MADASGKGMLARRFVQAPIHVYRRVLSPLKPPTCRFYPTCSAYALEAIEVHGPARGFWLALKRVSKCHPFHLGGIDLVPPARVNGKGASAQGGTFPRNEDQT